ncbi:MAG TPA: twin-arginine translocation signal domain-containing protein [Ktedonobacteraceae bacterium]|nr:twin-arginine translocation signal domain-containing protein [Ktedonobacteraceae bacterium]
MAENHNELEQVHESTSSRRTFLKWIGQVAAGASVAGIGFRTVTPLYALAKNKPFNCIDCSGCTVISCYLDSSCVGNPYGPLDIYYKQYVGCAPNCMTRYYHACQENCDSPC